MRKIYLTLVVVIACICNLYANDGSVYTQKPNDPEALYFTPENFNIKADGKMDVSDALQEAINKVKIEKNFGILFLPEGKYKISKTIHIPSSIRLIGYGKNRPEIILGANSPGFQETQNYMIWFTGGLAQPGRQPSDAGAGTFYSALSNINFRIEKGNPQAVAIRSHFAQHGFTSHSIVWIGSGKAGIYDAGNELENMKFYGGDYGIISNRSSPGWPIMVVDTYFEGQRIAAVQTRDAGLVIVNMKVKNSPIGVEMMENRSDRLYIENSYFENVKTAGVVVSVEGSPYCQLNMLNLYCKNVPTLVKYNQSGKTETVNDRQYVVKDYSYGLTLDDMVTPSDYKTISKIEPLAKFEMPKVNDIPALPGMETWVSVRDFGAKGDGETDDTKAFQDAIAKHKNVYVPQGWYRITETIKMNPGTNLIGLHPAGTQIIIKESEPAFSGYGAPKAMVESSAGGDDILNGIGINTGAYNYRAVGCKWMASERSLMNDVKYMGGHGTVRRPNPNAAAGQGGRPGGAGGRVPNISSPTNPVAAQGLDLAWDNQYWSLWITNNGGGTIKDIWTADSYATSGLFVSQTSTPGRIYAMSLEHHVRNEARFDNVSNWKVYAFQFEEEGREGKDCKMLEITNCNNIMFAGVWIYRVIRANTPQEFGARIWNSENIEFRNFHNYTQVLPVIEIPVYDVNKKIPVFEWDFARLMVTGKEKSNRQISNQPGVINKLGDGYEFAAGLTTDSKGNVYFCENRLKKIYKWDATTNTLTLLTDMPLKPFALATDTKDNLLVVFRYDPQPGLLINGVQETARRVADDNPMYSGWGNSGWDARVYSVNTNNPEETMTPLQRVPTSQVRNVSKIIYPSHRWRGDFARVTTTLQDTSFVALDGVTIIPDTYDLGRSATFTAVTPGQSEPVYIAHENSKSTVKLTVAANGKLDNMTPFHPQGQYSNVVDKDGNVYIADGQIFVYDKNGNAVKRITLEDRPISLAIGGTDKNTLFITTTKAFYSMRIK